MGRGGGGVRVEGARKAEDPYKPDSIVSRALYVRSRCRRAGRSKSLLSHATVGMAPAVSGGDLRYYSCRYLGTLAD